MARPKVLLVEDNQRICTQLRSLLESAQWEVSTATTGIEGILTFNRELPHLVVVEQFLPLLSGEELIFRLRQHLSPAQLPIIVLTSSRFGMLSPSLRSQVNAICQKPLHAQQFQEAVYQAYQATQSTVKPLPIAGAQDPEQFYLAWGDLLQTSLPTLLFQLKQQQHSGMLTLTLPQGERRFAFRQGELVYAEALIPEEQLIHFLHKRLAHRLDAASLEKVVAGTGARAALQREAISRAQIVPEKELNHLYHLYIENVIIRSLFLTQGPYQFLDDNAYVQRTAAMPINVLLLLFEGVSRYYTPQKLLQVISPYHLYRCKITPLYLNQISALIPRFQNVSFAPQRLSGRTVHELLREFTPNPQLSAQLLQTLSLARLILFEGPDGTTSFTRVSETMEHSIISESTFTPLAANLEYASAAVMHTPHPHYSASSMVSPVDPSLHQLASVPIQGERFLTNGVSTGAAAIGAHPPTEMIPAVVMQQMMRASTGTPTAPHRSPTGQHAVSLGSQVALGAQAAWANNNPTLMLPRNAEHPMMLDREAHLGALAGEFPPPRSQQPPVAPPAVARNPGLQRNPSLDNTYAIPPMTSSMSSSALSASTMVTTSLTPAGPVAFSNPGLSAPTVPTNPLAAGGVPPVSYGVARTVMPTNAPGTPVSSGTPFSPLISSPVTSPVSSPAPIVSPLVVGNTGGAAPSMYQIHGASSQTGLPSVAMDATLVPQTERSWTSQLDVDVLRVQTDNYFVALDLTEGASNEDIQSAYRRYMSFYTPERIQKNSDPEVRTKAGEVLRRISQAYSVLSDPTMRQQMEMRLAQKKSQVSNRLLFAQEQFRQGEACLQQRRYHEAAVFYKRALEENSKEPVYFLRLGWSMYCQDNPDPLQRLLARTYIERALQMNPIFEDAYLYLGLIRKQEGFLEDAASLFQRILLLNPGHSDAYRLLSEVSQRK